MKQVLGVILALAVLAGLGWLGTQIYVRVQEAQKQAGGEQRSTPAVAVAIAPVARSTVLDMGMFSGTLSPKSRFEVAPKVAGRIKQLLVNIGDPVKKDQLIALLDDDELKQQVEQARAELEMARANVEDTRSAIEVARSTVDVARKEFDRLTVLKQKGIASAADLDVAEAKLRAGEANFKASEAKERVAQAQINQRDAALRAAEIRLSYTQVHASWQEKGDSRVVGERFADEGALLKANDPIVSVLDEDVMIAVVHVIERDYPKVQVGQEAQVMTDAYAGRTFTGKVVRIAPLLRESSRQARLEIEVPNPQRLLHAGMFVRAQIEFARHENATVVPVAALVKRGGDQGVFLADVEKNKARFVPVTVGIISAQQAEITAPALSGQVVVLGQHLLENGSDIVLGGSRGKEGPAEAPGKTPSGTTTAKPAGEGS